MSQNAVKRLYLMQVGSMPEYQIPIVCYLVQTDDGKKILIDSGLPEIMPEGESEFENGQDVIEQLASIGLQPDQPVEKPLAELMRECMSLTAQRWALEGDKRAKTRRRA